MRIHAKNIALLALLLMFGRFLNAQYKENPLKDRKWASLSGGVNSADNVSWQVMGNLSSRGDFFVTQLRLGYSQELIEPVNDPFTFRKNRLVELSYLLGDGWGGKHWYATGTVGFGLNVRMYADSGDYQLRYVTTLSPAIPAQIDFGLLLNKQWGAGISVVGNLNFRQSYFGALLGVTYRMK